MPTHRHQLLRPHHPCVAVGRRRLPPLLRRPTAPPSETREGNIICVGTDVREWLPYGPVAFAAFFSPCTDTAIPGRAHFRRKGLSSVIKTLRMFKWSARLAAWCQCPNFIENLVSKHHQHLLAQPRGARCYWLDTTY